MERLREESAQPIRHVVFTLLRSVAHGDDLSVEYMAGLG